MGSWKNRVLQEVRTSGRMGLGITRGEGAQVRVLHVDTATEWRGGQTQVLRLALGMHDRGVETFVACPPAGRLWRELAPLGDRRIGIPQGWSLRTAWAAWRFAPDVVVAHTSHAHGCLALTPLPLVVHRWVDFPVRRSWKTRRGVHARASCTTNGLKLGRAFA